MYLTLSHMLFVLYFLYHCVILYTFYIILFACITVSYIIILLVNDIALTIWWVNSTRMTVL